ncbi:MAG: glycosyltransferase family 9 protein [Thermodesulfobacteriota bacterium]
MNWKIEGLKKLDGALGGISCNVSKFIVSPRKKTSEGLKKILVIRPGGIGDAVLLYPALRELMNHFPDASIDVLAEKRNAGIFSVCPYVGGIFQYDKRPHETLFKVIKEGYDVVIDTEQWHRLTAALSYLTRAPLRVGFETNERAGLFSHPVPYGQNDYEVYSFLNLVAAVTGENYDFDKESPFIPLDRVSYGGISTALSDFRKGKKAIVGLFAGATVAERRWGVKRFVDLSRGFWDEDIGTVIVGGKADKSDSEMFAGGGTNGYLLDYIGGTTLGETAAVISELDLFISGDSGLMHIAYGVGTPTVSLFGAGIEKKWAPKGGNHIAINKNPPCSPCTKFGYTPTCPYEVKCLADITVGEVKESAMKLLARSLGTRT